MDPYWAEWVSSHSSKEWITRGAAQRRVEAGTLAVPDELMTAPHDARAAILRANRDRSPYKLNTYVAILGAVNGWRTITSQQLAAFVGDPRLAKAISHPAAQLFCSELIATTVPSAWARGPARELGLYRPTGREAYAAIESDLTWAERTGITGGAPYGGGGAHDRHNVLAAELGLRSAEYLDVSCVLGETLSTPNHLVGEGAGRHAVDLPGGPDLTIVRPDGLRIAIELQSTTSPHYEKKVERIVKMLADAPTTDAGVVVLFVVAPPLDAPERRKKDLLRQTQQAIVRACKMHPGLSGDPTRRRVGVAQWTSWFPSSHVTSEGFMSFRAQRPVGSSTDGGSTWETAAFLSLRDVPFAPCPVIAKRSMPYGAAILGQTPYWMRESLQEVIEHNVRDGRVRRGRGVASAPHVPNRLVGLGSQSSLERVGRPVHVGFDEPPKSSSTGSSTGGRARSAALLRVTTGRSTVDAIVAEARGEGPRHPLREISLAQLLIAQEGVGPARAEVVLDRLAAFLGSDRPPRKNETVGWLADGRTGSRRLRAWKEARQVDPVAGGFPWIGGSG